MKVLVIRIALLVVLFLSAATAQAQGPVFIQREAPSFNLSRQKVLYCVGYAHLDTQWRWDYATTIDRYIKATMDENFALFEKYPEYVFNFTGSIRYEMMKEYYPEDYERVKQYIADGRWFVSGSSVDENDANVPSPESMIRQVLYGNNYFKREFGKESVDYMLPDCFGFPAYMPSVWAHCGLLGFSTQKLTWGSAVGIPFKIGVWEGPDGKSVIAALDPGPYAGGIKGRVDTNKQWAERIKNNGEQFGIFADYHYYGVGDIGGAPKDEDVANYIASIDNPDSEFHVALTSSDQMYKDITPFMATNLPRYKGDLLLTEHSAGTLTSQSYMKRWNRKCEQLADAAERAATAASWLTGMPYPRKEFETYWTRFLGNQMHDILPGTSIPRAYTYSWNDEVIAMNGFAGLLEDSVGAISKHLDTQVQGVPIVVYNPLAARREDPVEARVKFEGGVPVAARVFDPSGKEVPSQELRRDELSITLLFIANVPSVSFNVFDVRPAEQPYTDAEARLQITETTIENAHYRVTIDDAGDVSSVIDKDHGDRELLSKPAQLVFTYEKPQHYPAWNMDWADRQKPPTGVVDGKPTMRIVERGPVRVSLEIEREARGSIFTQRLHLYRGDAGRVVYFDTTIDWQSTECALKASFPLTASNPNATYNWGLGTIERGNNDPTKYEVPAHEWFDLTDASGDFGVTVIEDSKYGSDKPSDNELRLTLLYTPGVRSSYLDQHSQDWGRHDMVYGLYGHRRDWKRGHSEWRGRRLNQPLRAFQVTAHAGNLGKSWWFTRINTPELDIRAIKFAEDRETMILRVQELWGETAENVLIQFAAPANRANDADGQERMGAGLYIFDGAVGFTADPYSIRSVDVSMPRSPHKSDPPKSVPVALPYDTDVLSFDGDRTDGDFDGTGRTIPAEQLPDAIAAGQITFSLGSKESGSPNAVTCAGQSIDLPEGSFVRLYVLAAADEDTTGEFTIGDRTYSESIRTWTGFVGQWDNRVWNRPFEEVDFTCEGQVIGIQPGYIKRDRIAWFCTHHHDAAKGNIAYHFSYLYRYGFDIPEGAKTLTLPNDPRIKVLAVTCGDEPVDVAMPCAPLYDDFTGRKPIELRYEYPPPPKTLFEGVESKGAVMIDRAETFDALSMGPPSMSDYADQSAGNGGKFQCYIEDGNYHPHPGSGLVNGAFPRLNDGEVAQNHDDTRRCVWYDNEGRFFVDLGKSAAVVTINTYSWHRSNRAPQYFSVWGASGESMPDAGISRENYNGWELLGAVDSRALGNGGVHGSSIHAKEDKPLGNYRWLLFVAENIGEGTFFTEIDVNVQP